MNRWLRTGLVVLLAVGVIACGGKQDADRASKQGESVEPARDITSPRPVPQRQVVYYATDRKAVPMDVGWYLARFRFAGLVVIVGGLFVWTLFRVLAPRFRWFARVVAGAYVVLAIAATWSAFWEVRFDVQLAERVGRFYGAERGTYGGPGRLPLELGRMEVSVPLRHTEGVLERPDPLAGEFHEDPRKHWLIARLEVRDDHAGFFREVAADAVGEDALLVFVHGYNTSFKEGAHRTAQIAWDLAFSGPALYYSWPSAGQLENYEQDDQNVKWTRLHLKAFLQALVRAVPDKRIHLIAHSMGNRALTRALERMRLEDLEAREAARGRGEEPPPATREPFQQIVLAAPDIDAAVFRDDLVPAIRGEGRRITLLASTKDEALQASREWNGEPRAGDADPDHIVVVEGVETVDVSAVAAGHSYIGDNGFVLGVLRQVFAGAPRPIQSAAEARARTREVPTTSPQGLRYWRLVRERR